MVLSGTVVVRATVGGAEQTKTAHVARQWTGMPAPPYPTTVEGQGTLRPEPLAAADLGRVTFDTDTTAGGALVAGAVTVVAEGPNEELLFVATVPPLIRHAHIFINNAALTTGSAFWSGQLDKPKAVGTACLRADVTSARTRSLILAHEGTQMERDSHNELMKRAGDGLIAPAVEGVVGRDAQFVAQWSTAIALVFAEMLRRATATDDINPVRFGCNFNFVYSTPKNGA